MKFRTIEKILSANVQWRSLHVKLFYITAWERLHKSLNFDTSRTSMVVTDSEANEMARMPQGSQFRLISRLKRIKMVATHAGFARQNGCHRFGSK